MGCYRQQSWNFTAAGVKVLLMKLLSVALALASIAACLAQDGAPKEKQSWLRPNGYFRAESGLFSLSGHTLCSYSSSKAGDETKCYALEREEWKATSIEDRSEDYLDFAPCDPLNQLSVGVQHRDFAKLLPRSAAIKQVIEAENFAFVAYSDTPANRVRYSLRIAAMRKSGDKWTVGADHPVGSDGSFCGMRWIHERNGSVILVYVDEPAGSADYSAISSFWVSRE
jgi:hypothetical protein